MSLTGTKFSGTLHEIIIVLLISIPGTAGSFKAGILKSFLFKIKSNTVTLIIQLKGFEIISTGLFFIGGLFHLIGKLHTTHDRFTDLGNSRAETLKRIRNIRSAGNRKTWSTGGTSGRTSDGTAYNGLGIKTSRNSITNLGLKRIIILIAVSLILGNITALILYISLIKGILIIHQTTLLLCSLTNLFFCSCKGTNTANKGTSSRHQSANT